MRKITEECIRHFNQFRDFKMANTEILHKAILGSGKFPQGDHFIVMELFGNEIAAIDSKSQEVWITNAGWKSNTTKERLNAIDGVNIYQRKGDWYLNGQLWDGKWTMIGKRSQDDGMSFLRSIGMIMAMGDIMADDQKQANDWKKRMLSAGLEGRGLHMPEDWDKLSEQEKQKRLDGVSKLFLNQ